MSVLMLLQVITALISNFQRLGDQLKEVRVGEWKFVFLCKGPIYVSDARGSAAVCACKLKTAAHQCRSLDSPSCSLAL
jgi:hypothetical protein